MPSALVIGGVSFNLMIYLGTLPAPVPHSVASRGFNETIGSTGAGKALNLCKLGFDTTLHAPVGDDANGRWVANYLAAAGVRFLYDIDPMGTQRHVNLMDASGRRVSIFIVPGTFEPAFDRARLAALLPGSDYVLLNISNYCRQLIPDIRAAGKAIWCDLHDYDGQNPYHDDFIAAADFVLLSSDALPGYRDFMARMIAQGKRLVVCTHGAQGSTALTAAGEWIETPIIAKYAPVDTNGAGDSFFVGLLYGHAQGLAVRQCLRLGTVASGLCVTTRELAFPGLSPALLRSEYAAAYGEPLRLE